MKSDAAIPEWCEAVRDEDSTERKRFLEAHVDLVRYVALRFAARLPSSVEVDDLIHDGVLGLLDACSKYDPERGVLFRTYAERRVRGAILDGLRHRDWQPRTVRRGQRELDQTISRLSATRGRAASEEEIAEAMGLDLPQLRQLLQDTSTGPLLPLDELPGGAHPTQTTEGGQPHEALERRELLEAVAEEIVRLPDRERQAIALYYHEGLNMKEIGAVLRVTESRICQIHAQAAARLRAALRARLHCSPRLAVAGSTGERR